MKNKSKEKNKLSSQRAITLIALVVTIVVLLILAGVSLNLVLGNNGIINKAQEAKVETRAGVVDDEVNLWKTENYLADNTNDTSETDKEMIARLRENKLITDDDEVDTENKKIIIKKKDGTVVREISYEYENAKNVIINISKTPETEDVGNVLLQVTSVQGLTVLESKDNKEELKNKLELMSIDDKVSLYENLFIKFANTQMGKDFKTFAEAVAWLKENGGNEFPFETEEEYINAIKNSNEEDLNNELCEMIISTCYNQITDRVELYEILNPEGIESTIYVAQENGKYTFTVKDILTDKTYSKTVEVNNIRKDMELQYKIGVINDNRFLIGLLNNENEESTTFEKAYIVYNNEKIDISTLIENNEEYQLQYVNTYEIIKYMIRINKIKDWRELHKTSQILIIVKDGIEYTGIVTIYSET